MGTAAGLKRKRDGTDGSAYSWGLGLTRSTRDVVPEAGPRRQTVPRTRSQEVGGPPGVYSRLGSRSTAILLGERSRDPLPIFILRFSRGVGNLQGCL